MAQQQTQPEAADPAAPPLPAASSLAGPALQILRQRADFLRAAQARRQGAPGFLLQARERGEAAGAMVPADEIRIGFTCSKKIGNAVTRNRAKRRLRALAREVLPGIARPGWDYVLIGRPGATVDRDYALLLQDLHMALRKIHAQPEPQPGRDWRGPRGPRRGKADRKPAPGPTESPAG